MRHFDVRAIFVALAFVSFALMYPLQNYAFAQSSTSPFPGAGRKFSVVFPAFRAILDFHSDVSLTWTLLNPDGSHGRTETVAIRTQEVAHSVYLVTWQEANKTTVVQIEDFSNGVIFTNITRPDGTFLQNKGTFSELR